LKKTTWIYKTVYLLFWDDIVTSPLDQYYVEDLAKSVIELNNQGYLRDIV
jgi:hypothetical protein